MCVALVGHHGKNGVGRYAGVIQQVGAVAGHNDLGLPGGTGQRLTQCRAGSWVQCGLGLFNTYQRGGEVPVALEEGGQHAERAQCAIGHVLGFEAPRRAVSYVLPEFQGLLAADLLALNTVNHRHHNAQILLDGIQLSITDTLQVAYDTGNVLALFLEELSVLWGLQVTHQPGVEVVEAHGGQCVEHRTKCGRTGNSDQGQTV